MAQLTGIQINARNSIVPSHFPIPLAPWHYNLLLYCVIAFILIFISSKLVKILNRLAIASVLANKVIIPNCRIPSKYL